MTVSSYKRTANNTADISRPTKNEKKVLLRMPRRTTEDTVLQSTYRASDMRTGLQHCNKGSKETNCCRASDMRNDINQTQLQRCNNRSKYTNNLLQWSIWWQLMDFEFFARHVQASLFIQLQQNWPKTTSVQDPFQQSTFFI